MAYKTVSELFSAEIEEKRSRFIATLVPIAEFERILADLRISHRKANHHVTAFRSINSNNQINELGKDDGEPSGTSGMPVLKTLIGAELMDVGIIVTRYFGGTKLGTGGLARAYSGAANAAIEIARLEPWRRLLKFEVAADFKDTNDLEALISKTGAVVLERDYQESGTVVRIEVAEDVANEFANFRI